MVEKSEFECLNDWAARPPGGNKKCDCVRARVCVGGIPRKVCMDPFGGESCGWKVGGWVDVVWLCSVAA